MNFLKTHINQKQFPLFTWTRWHWIRLCMCVKIRSTMCSIVLCSSNIIRAKSNSTWFLFTSNWDFSYSWAFLSPIPQNCKYDANIWSKKPKKKKSLIEFYDFRFEIFNLNCSNLFVIFRKSFAVQFVHNLGHTNHITRRVFDWHA